MLFNFTSNAQERRKRKFTISSIITFICTNFVSPDRCFDRKEQIYPIKYIYIYLFIFPNCTILFDNFPNQRFLDLFDVFTNKVT